MRQKFIQHINNNNIICDMNGRIIIIYNIIVIKILHVKVTKKLYQLIRLRGRIVLRNLREARVRVKQVKRHGIKILNSRLVFAI